MRILFVGGTGLISSAVSPLVIERGHDLTLVNRGTSAKASAPAGARVIQADAHDTEQLRALLAADVRQHGEYDAVVQWICFSPEHMRADLETFAGVTREYIFISSASAYQTPPQHYIAREGVTPVDNPYWQYSRDKAACEQLLREAGADTGFPYTIVRPSHTYGYSDIPLAITSWSHPWTVMDRLLRGNKVLIHGDGTSLWTLTDHRDFAVGLVGLLGNAAAVGEAVNITGDDVLSWNQIYTYAAQAVGIDADRFANLAVHVPTDVLIRFDRDTFEGPLMGDKTHSGVFDHSTLSRLVPEFATRHHFRDSVNESVAWFQADSSRRGLDDGANALWDRIIDRYTAAIDAAVTNVTAEYT